MYYSAWQHASHRPLQRLLHGALTTCVRFCDALCIAFCNVQTELHCALLMLHFNVKNIVCYSTYYILYESIHRFLYPVLHHAFHRVLFRVLPCVLHRKLHHVVQLSNHTSCTTLWILPCSTSCIASRARIALHFGLHCPLQRVLWYGLIHFCTYKNICVAFALAPSCANFAVLIPPTLRFWYLNVFENDTRSVLHRFFWYICCITLNPTRIVTYLLMRNRTTRFVLFNTSTPVDLFHHLHGTSGLILISLPFLLHLTTIGNNAQNICCKFRSSICTLNRHLSGTPCSCSRNT